MILADIDSLSLVELRNLAQQEGLEDVDSMNRNELTDSLLELLETSEAGFQRHTGAVSLHGGQRYISALSDCPGHGENQKMPGVSELPELYKETSIHIMLRDPQWAYVYWSVAPRTMNRLLELDATYQEHFFLRVTATDCETERNSIFEVEVDKTDTTWYVNLPQLGCAYQVALCCRNSKGRMIALAQSMGVKVDMPYWYRHLDELADNPMLFNGLFSSIVTKSGKFKDTVVVEPLFKMLSQGETD
ncbi:MAG: DUF4912 domain-containing protein [Spirochaetia bacterium]|jgi:hypothetical protein|nr:DUF4912 domain-containing protein [Spirochaetia bacterium]